jgi:hypothetical protein
MKEICHIIGNIIRTRICGTDIMGCCGAFLPRSSGPYIRQAHPVWRMRLSEGVVSGT